MTDGFLPYTVSATTFSVEWKPLGRGRKFERAARGLARRLRLPFVRRTLWELDNPQAHHGNGTVTYGPMWTSHNALANYSFACPCSNCGRPRYSRKDKHRKPVDCE